MEVMTVEYCAPEMVDVWVKVPVTTDSAVMLALNNMTHDSKSHELRKRYRLVTQED